MKKCLLPSCQKVFQSYKKSQKYCSYDCSIKHRSYIYREQRKCLWCNTPFKVVKSDDKKFCTIGCSRRYHHNGDISLKEYKEKHKCRAYIGGYINRHGYIAILKPDHPNACKGYVYEHRYLMEQKLGRLLTPNEIVHHKDGNKSNNDIANLEVITRRQHRSLIYATVTCPHCQKTFNYEAHSQKRPEKNRLEGL